jgi:hypothetical protein
LDFVYSWPLCGTSVSVFLFIFYFSVRRTNIDFGVIWERCKSLVQSLVHFGSVAFEKPSAACRHQQTLTGKRERKSNRTSREKRVSRKDSTLIPVLEEIAYTILRMARRVQRFDSDAVAELPRLAVGRRLGDGLTVLATNDGQLAEGFELDMIVNTDS